MLFSDRQHRATGLDDATSFQSSKMKACQGAGQHCMLISCIVVATDSNAEFPLSSVHPVSNVFNSKTFSFNSHSMDRRARACSSGNIDDPECEARGFASDENFHLSWVGECDSVGGHWAGTKTNTVPVGSHAGCLERASRASAVVVTGCLVQPWIPLAKMPLSTILRGQKCRACDPA